MKFLLENIFLIAVALISGGMLFLPNLQRRGNQVSQLRATQLINHGKTVVLDVRPQPEFVAGHLPDARNIPLPDLPQRIGELERSKTKTVIVVCDNGAQSAKAVTQLAKAGFADVTSLAGGIAAWRSQGLPVVK
ncbi:MAG: rhodanese-like domain-containing protein [Burkholderiaceae bacterium]